MSEELKKLKDDHKDFRGESLDKPPSSPFELFSTWFDAAVKNQELESNAMCVSTVGQTGMPSSRIVYLKELRNEEFVYYTNYSSQKGTELALNPNASILFFWPKMQRQIRISGITSKISAEESDAYFASRPRESQLGAWASHQSELLENSEELKTRVAMLNAKYPEEVPRPPHWGGYALIPMEIEFWQGQPSRLHDRLVYSLMENTWRQTRKNP
jgi:pyridoxamine 5'-phosphate oxidase